ncbi:hypothetical protein [Tardiphaga sp.]|jgi:hypothetical protein|uniref:hypothetical protein n=1 Tax=Tardiphaga sp. TaxID=1926292 RepID=UPI000784B06F
MKIDLKRLRSDVKRLKADRVDSPIGKIKTGATEIIRRHFDELERMHHEDGASWTEIAAGLAAQGVTQGDGQPLTGRRLTALMHNIRVRAEKLRSKGAVRRPSEHLPNPSQKLGRRSRKMVSLAPEMSRERDAQLPDQVISEEEIRRTELSKHAHLLRKR